MPPSVSPEIRQAQQDTNNCLGLKGVLQIVDRALSGVDDLTIEIVEPDYYTPNAPAWTNGKKISMNKELVLKTFAEQDLPTAILTFKGTNFHELAHVLFTPRKEDAIGRWIKSNQYKYQWAWNALEDQRIETLYTALYPHTVPYFRNSSYRWLLEKTVGEEHFYRVYSLVGGRKYIDRPVRRAARQAFVDHYGAEVTDQLDAVVNEYVALPLPGCQERAIELVEEFYNLLKGTDLRNYLNKESKCGGQGASKNGEVDPEKAVEAAVRVREQLEDEAEQDEADGPQTPTQAPAGGYPEDDQDDQEQDETEQAPSAGGYPEDDEDEDTGSDSGGDQDGEADSDGESQDSSGESDTQSNEDSDTPSKGGSTGTRDKPPTDPAQDLQDAINEALADVLTDEDLKNEIDRTVESFRAASAGKGQAEEQPAYNNFTEVDAEADTVNTVQKIIAQLRTLKTDAEAAWIKERITGNRVNLNHVIRNQADPTHLEIFEQWDEGYEEEAKTEVVIALDLSYSMDDVLPQCSQALWALKKAFDKVEVPTTVLGFSAGNVVLYNKDEKLRGLKVRQFNQWSGTEPRDTLLYAHRLFARSEATNKVLIVITDGIWQGDLDDGADAKNVVADLRRRGASTLLFGVNGHRVTNRDHGFEQCADITEIGDIVKVIKELVVNIQQKAGGNK